MQQNLTAERLRELLTYEPATGHFIWRKAKSNRRAIGDHAGCLHKASGYLLIGIDGRLYRAHRLAWLYMTGEWPRSGVDHRDGAPANNAWSNLREATQAENMQNLQRAMAHSRTGLLGAQRNRSGQWFARIKAGNITAESKRFKTAMEAHLAYLEMKTMFHPFSTIGRA